MADKTAFDVLSALTQQEYLIDPAAEKLRLRLNEIIDEDRLDHLTVMAALVRLSAAYVHQIQKGIADPSARQYIEDQFYELFQAYLAMHEEGDKYIQAGSELICNQFQHSPVYRIGGDEFVVILEGEDYRARLELLSAFDHQMEENQKAGIVTVSSGLDTFRPGRDIDFNSIFERADQRMYERKKYLKSLVANNG